LNDDSSKKLRTSFNIYILTIDDFNEEKWSELIKGALTRTLNKKEGSKHA